MELATDDGQRWFRHLKKESTRRADLEQQVETMAKQLRSLEKHAQKAYTLQRSGAGPSATASEKAPSRLAVTGAGVGSAVIITQPASSGTSGAGATGSGVGRNGGSRKRVPPGSGGSSQRAPPGSPSSSSAHSQNDNSISPLAVTPIRTPPDQPAPPLQPLLASSPTFSSSSSSNTQAAQAGNLRVLLPGEQQHPAAARLVPNVSMPSFSGLVSTSSTPSLSPSPSPVGSSNARPALEPPESNVADDGMPIVLYSC